MPLSWREKKINVEDINSELHRISYKDHPIWPLPSWPDLSSEVSTQIYAELLPNQMLAIPLLHASTQSRVLISQI